MFGLQSVDRDHEVEAADLCPFLRYFAHRTCYYLNGDTAFGQLRQKCVKFTESNKRFAADDRKMKRFMVIDKIKDAVDEALAL